MPHLTDHRSATLCDALDRILSRGAILRGEIVISVAEVDLVYVGLSALVASVDKAAEIGGIWGTRSILTERQRTALSQVPIVSNDDSRAGPGPGGSP